MQLLTSVQSQPKRGNHSAANFDTVPMITQAGHSIGLGSKAGVTMAGSTVQADSAQPLYLPGIWNHKQAQRSAGS
jgi:hypothetical protein